MFVRLAKTITDKAIEPTIEAVSYYITRMLQPIVMEVVGQLNATAKELSAGQVATANGSIRLGSGTPDDSFGDDNDV